MMGFFVMITLLRRKRGTHFSGWGTGRTKDKPHPMHANYEAHTAHTLATEARALVVFAVYVCYDTSAMPVRFNVYHES